MNLSFKEWLIKEVGTSTSSVACFLQPLLSEPVRRGWDKKPKKKNTKNDIAKT
jgi:hypothetical protein